MLIKDGRVLGIGSPETVLTRDLLKKAFDVGIEIKKQNSGGAYISYENNF
jgi:ABC-type cobalamin/Fe3+-siderophores transport system ATPase subunit